MKLIFKKWSPLINILSEKKKHLNNTVYLTNWRISLSPRKWWQLQMISKEDSLTCTSGLQSRPGTADGSTLCVKGSVKQPTPSAIKWISGFQLLLKIMSISLHWPRLCRKVSTCDHIWEYTTDQAVLGTNKLQTTKGESAALTALVKLTIETAQTPVSNGKPVFDLKANVSSPQLWTTQRKAEAMGTI